MVFKKKQKKPEFDPEAYKKDLEQPLPESDEPEYQEPETGKEKAVWVIQDVPTETQRVIVNTKTKKAFDIYSAIVEILNRTEE